MSLHKQPLLQMEREGLIAHGLPTESPSQLSDAFRHGVAWAEANKLEDSQDWEQLAYRYQAERDALAAHVERARLLSEQIELADNQSEFNQSANRLCRHLDEAPSTSLNSLKIDWQVEALEAHAQGWVSTHRCDEMFAARTIRDVLLSEAQKIRRQAEEAV